MKKAIFVVLAAMLVTLPEGNVAARDAKGQYSIYGQGNIQCAIETGARLAGSEDYILLETWVAGYMTAAAYLEKTQKAFGDVMDLQSIMSLIRQHCEAHPFDDLADAADSVLVQLLDKAGRR